VLGSELFINNVLKKTAKGSAEFSINYFTLVKVTLNRIQEKAVARNGFDIISSGESIDVKILCSASGPTNQKC
jgi:hypothetical protein